MSGVQARVLAATTELSHEDWLRQRKLGIGGSDAAAVMGMSKYATPFTVWANKTNRMPEPEANERMRLGIALESYVADRFSEIEGKRVRRRNAILTNDKYPFAIANIDREIVGEKAGLECKTTSILNLGRLRGDGCPEEYYCQCVHYLAVTGYDRWYLYVLVLGSSDKPYSYVIERDEAEIDALMDAERAFWENHIMPDIPPPVDGEAPTSGALVSVYPGGVKDEIQIDQHGAAASYLELGVQIGVLEDQREKMAQLIKADMGDHELARCGSYSITWKPQQRTTFDHKTLASDNPHLDLSRYFKTTSTRQLRVKGDKSHG